MCSFLAEEPLSEAYDHVISLPPEWLRRSDPATRAACPNLLHTSPSSTTSMFYSSAPASLGVADTCFAQSSCLLASLQVLASPPLTIRWGKTGEGVLRGVTDALSFHLSRGSGASAFAVNEFASFVG